MFRCIYIYIYVYICKSGCIDTDDLFSVSYGPPGTLTIPLYWWIYDYGHSVTVHSRIFVHSFTSLAKVLACKNFIIGETVLTDKAHGKSLLSCAVYRCTVWWYQLNGEKFKACMRKITLSIAKTDGRITKKKKLISGRVFLTARSRCYAGIENFHFDCMRCWLTSCLK